MNLSQAIQLANLLATDAYQALADDAAILEYANTTRSGGDKLNERFVDYRSLSSLLGAVPAATIKAKLDNIDADHRAALVQATGADEATVTALLSVADKMLSDAGSGLNICDPQTIGIIDALAGTGIITTDEANAVTALQHEQINDAQRILGRAMVQDDIDTARGWQTASDARQQAQADADTAYQAAISNLGL